MNLLSMSNVLKLSLKNNNLAYSIPLLVKYTK
jgi:hypothetical protein